MAETKRQDLREKPITTCVERKNTITPGHCPFCGSNDVEWHISEKLDNEVKRPAHCRDCATSFDQYENLTFSGIRVRGIEERLVEGNPLVLSTGQLIDACKASLKAFRAIYDSLEKAWQREECEIAGNLLMNKNYWPLSQLREAIGEKIEKSTTSRPDES